MAEEFDIVCLGAGPAGEALAAELAGSGISLAVVEKNLVGGECAYWGCMPSKTLLRAAETIAEAGRTIALSTSTISYVVDYPKVHARTFEVARKLDDSGAKAAIESSGASVLRGAARLTGPRTVVVGDVTLVARKAVVVATGSSAAMPPIDGIKDVDAWTNHEAVLAEQLPESLLVVGGGAVGAELCQAFVRLGSKVHLVESGDHVVALEEPEVGRYLQSRLVAEGVHVVCSARAQKVERIEGGVRLSLATGEQIDAERILFATGRRPNTEGINFDAAGLTRDQRGWIKTDPQTLLAGDGIYAAGDITGLGGFTHLSHYHGTWIGKMLKGEDVKVSHAAIPRVTFTDPEVAAVGMIEARAREAGINISVATEDLANSARSYIHGEPGGFVKVIADRDRDVIIGASICSPRAGEMINEFVLAIRAEVPLAVMRDVVHPFPSFSRILQGVIARL